MDKRFQLFGIAEVVGDVCLLSGPSSVTARACMQ
jgi:hypothetical protein